VHVLHCDEQVSPGFHRAAKEAFQLDPAVTLFAAVGTPSQSSSPGADTALLSGRPAMQTVLGMQKPATGAFVLRRGSDRFDPTYSYCPDEELFPRLASKGLTAVSHSQWVFSTPRPDQARRATWLEGDWVDVYVAARLRNASSFGPGAEAIARQSTVRNVLSVVASLVTSGQTAIARRHLDRLEDLLPEATDEWRFAVAKRMATWPGGVRLMRLRRRGPNR
jgi:hypothetical protein